MHHKISGLGLGLRFVHLETILQTRPATPWFEVVVDDFLEEGPHHSRLSQLRQDYPIAFHSVGLNIGGTDPLNLSYLNKLKDLYSQFEPEWVSDHLCWTAHGGYHHHDLMPIPRNHEALLHVCQRVDFIQEFFKRPIAVENVTSYIEFNTSEMSEFEFIAEVVSKTGCGLLFDISNLLINCSNKNLEVTETLSSVPLQSVVQFHLAGGTQNKEVIIDTHAHNVENPDIMVYKDLVDKGFDAPAIIERDQNFPAFEELEKERLDIEKVVYGS